VMKHTVKNSSTLLEVVMEMYYGISRQKAKQLIGFSSFTVNGEKVKNHPNLSLQPGQIVELQKKTKIDKSVKLPSKQKPISIFFEDNYLVIGLKPPGILSCRDRAQETTPSFHKHLEAFIHERDDKKLRLWPVHRLDKEVEGLIIFAKSEDYQQLIKSNWQEVTKKYLALTEGKPEPESGVIESWLREGDNQKVYSLKKEAEGSKFAKTEYTYIRKEKGYHLLEISLHTGRKNQIRAHLSSIGCPIVGDRRYGADDSYNRQIRLAAYKLDFKHPITANQIRIEYNPASSFFKPSQNEDEKYRIL
jgi:23S rRNA pseudouridine1911/1915/1917 synthase